MKSGLRVEVAGKNPDADFPFGDVDALSAGVSAADGGHHGGKGVGGSVGGRGNGGVADLGGRLQRRCVSGLPWYIFGENFIEGELVGAGEHGFVVGRGRGETAVVSGFEARRFAGIDGPEQ